MVKYMNMTLGEASERKLPLVGRRLKDSSKACLFDVKLDLVPLYPVHVKHKLNITTQAKLAMWNVIFVPLIIS